MPENFVETVEISTRNMAWKEACQKKSNGINDLRKPGVGTRLAYIWVQEEIFNKSDETTKMRGAWYAHLGSHTTTQGD